MNSEQLTKLVIQTLQDNKAIDITTLDVTSLTQMIDNMIICTATSTRHAKALADKLVRAAKDNGVRPLGTEGEEQGEWVLIDLTDIIVHIMLAPQREFYNLEKLWAATEQHRNHSTPS